MTPKIKQYLGMCWQILLAFSLFASSTTLVAHQFENKPLYTTDDPFLYGLLAGGIASSLLVICYFAHLADQRVFTVAGSILAICCGLLLLSELGMTEGQGIPTMMAAAIFAVGICFWAIVRWGWPWLRARSISPWLQILIAVAGITFLVLYLKTIKTMQTNKEAWEKEVEQRNQRQLQPVEE